MATIARSERVERAERPARPAAAGEFDYRPSYAAAGVASLLVFVLYLLTLSPSTAMWDASEYIASAYVLGIPHPPGNPFFVLIGHVFTHLPIAPTVAQRINILAALCSAVSAGMWFLITERVLVGWLPRRWQRIVGGSLAALIGATAFTVWNQSVVNEKVYTVSLAFFAIVAWLTVLWTDDPEGPKADRILILIAFLLGLGYTNHPAGLLVGPAVGFAVLARRWQTILRWRLVVGALFAFALGLTPFIYQPIRAAQFPAINEGEPTACTTKLEAACTFSKVTKDRFMANVNREQYGKPQLSDRQAPLSAQVGMWWLYFKWQWLRDAHDEMPAAQAALAVVFLLLGGMGGYVHWKRDRRSFWFFGPLMFTVTVALIVYMNFKYGYSQASELGDSVPREVRDRDYFYLWSYSAWSVWAALGLIFIWESVAALIGSDAVRVGRETVEEPRRTSWIAAAPVLALALVPLVGNWKQASRHGQTDTRDFAHDLLESVEPYGVIVTVGDNDTFPLWYAQEVEGIRKDVIVANTSLLNTDWYPRQLVRRPVYEYDAAKGPAEYRGKEWKKPSGPPVKLTMDQLDALPVYQELPQPQLFKTANITATIDPRRLQNGVLEKADVFVLRMLLDAFPARPIYFSRTSGSYAQSLGLGPYLLTQGLARRVLPAEPTHVGRDTVVVSGEGYVDLPRTKALWDNVFEAPKSLIRRGDWVDKPSVGIPFLYVTTGLILSDALNQSGQQQAANKVLQTAEQVARATRLDDLFQQAHPRAPLPLPADTTAGTAVPLK
jgi:hypothetical protein